MGDKVSAIFQRLLSVQYPMILLDMVQGMFYAMITFFDYFDNNVISRYFNLIEMVCNPRLNESQNIVTA
jgi:hypothetical protein